jgi:hypothetical protein
MSGRACGPRGTTQGKAGCRSSSVIVAARLISAKALVYVPDAVSERPGADNLAPLGEAANTARVHLEVLENRGQSPGLRRRELTWCDELRSDCCGWPCPKWEYEVYLAVSLFVRAALELKTGSPRSRTALIAWR